MRSGARSWSLATLSSSTIVRISVDLGVGVGLAVVAVRLNAGGWLNAIVGLIVAIVGGFVAFYILKKFLQWFVVTAGAPSRRRALWRTLKRHPLLGLLVLSFAIGALPTALLVVMSVWVCLLAERRGRASEHRWTRYATDVVIAALAGLGLLLNFDPDLLATQPTAGLFFAVGAWFSIRVWRVMVGSRRWAVRAGADIALSLLLGADLVLLVVWGANLLDLPHAEIAIVRSTLERVGSIADLPWPLWVGLYVLLAGLSLAFALWPDRLTAIVRWSQRFRVVPSIDVSRRVLSGVHIGLLVTVLIGLTAPASLEATLRGPLKAKYTVALQREWDTRGEQPAYAEIRRRFTTSTGTSSPMQALVVIVIKIHSISPPPSGGSDATSTERDLARRLGQLQASTLQLTVTPSALAAHQTVTDLAHFDPPIRNASELDDRLGRLDTQQRKADTTVRRVNQAAEFAATAVANTIQIPGFGENEIVQIIKEYLSGLVESSPLKDVFAAWAEKLLGATPPPRADTMVVPDPERLERAAFTALTQEKARTQLTNPATPDQAQTRAQTESPADAAVDLVNETRYLDEQTGPCDGCPQPLRSGDEPHRGPGEHPVRPVEPVRPIEPPHIRIPIIFW